MRALTDLFAYNAWANAQVFATCLAADQARLDAEEHGTYGTITETLKHLAQVEIAYSLMLRDEPLPTGEAREEFFTHSLAWFADAITQAGQTYSALAASADDAFYTAPLHVPWFDFALTKLDGLLQVLTHSAQHRAQVFSALGQHGVEVPNLDYVYFVERRQAEGS